MSKLVHRLLYRLLPLDGYLRVVSGMFFVFRALGLGRRSRALEYVYHLPELLREGDVAIDIGANLGYYTRPMARIVGAAGRVYAVEPVPVIFGVLRRNVDGMDNVELFNCALGEQERDIEMANDSVASGGYFGTGRNFVSEGGAAADAITFTARMRRGSELFGGLERIDFIKCDIEGYETVVMREMRPLIERHRPTVLIETGGGNRRRIVEMFRGMGYSAFTLGDDGREHPLAVTEERDIIFRYLKERK